MDTFLFYLFIISVLIWISYFILKTFIAKKQISTKLNETFVETGFYQNQLNQIFPAENRDKNVYDLNDYELILVYPYKFRFFRFKKEEKFLMEITCGTHGLWEIFFILDEKEKQQYFRYGDKYLKELAHDFSYNCYNKDYQCRYVFVKKNINIQ